MKEPINLFQIMGYHTLACCCGHNLYPRTVVVEKNGLPYEFYSGQFIPRKKRFYRRDAQGIFFIPEVTAANSNELLNGGKPSIVEVSN
jgi:hypothetical protein